MGTNYYLHIDSCPHCKKPDTKLHIGKSSMGWKFMFHEEPAYWGSFLQVKQWIYQDNTKIFNEYGDEVKKLEFIDLVLEKQAIETNKQDHYDYLDEEGYRFSKSDFS